MKHRTVLMLFVILSVSALCEKVWAADGNQCTKHVLAPGYPRLAWLARITGTVLVNVEMAADGTVRSANASGGHNLLNRASEENIRKWIFCPGAKDLTLEMTYVYRLEGEAEDNQSEPKVSYALPRVEIVSHPATPHVD
jgi:TonB family protein